MSIANPHPTIPLNHSGSGDNVAGDKIVNNYHRFDQAKLQEIIVHYFQNKVPNTLKLTHDINISPPPIPIKHSKRTSLIESLKLELTNATLLHIRGEIGTGKTQLCNLLVIDIGKPIYWFRIRQYKDQLPPLMVELKNSIENSRGLRLPKVFSKALRILPNSILVLDDLPNLVECNIEESFYQLLEICKKYNILIISSSNYDLPQSIFQYSDAIKSIHIPNFTEDNTIELLQTYHAPERIIKLANLINLFSDSHPYLIMTTINYLNSQKWEIDYDSLFKNKFIENELEYFQKMLNTTVKDVDTKELIYRLNSIGRTVTTEEIRLVSSVKPSIMHPIEKINTLLNNWIFKEGENEYLLSPLIYKLGPNNLDPQVEKNINFTLGTHIFNKETVNPYDVFRGISHLIKAKEINTAGFRLFQALHSIAQNEDVHEDDVMGIHLFWSHGNLPPEMDMGIQLFIRTMQIIVQAKFGKATAILYSDYLNLESKLKVSATEFDSLSLLLSYFMLAQFHFSGVIYGQKAYMVVANMSEDQKQKLDFPDSLNGEPIEVFLFMNIQDIKNIEDLSTWISFIKSIDTEKLKELFESEFALISLKILKNNIRKRFLSEDDNKVVSRLLLDLAQFAYENKTMILWAYLVASAIECLLKKETNIDDANLLLEQSLEQTDNRELQLLISNNFAMFCVDKEEYKKALSVYTKFIDLDNTPTLGDEALVDSYVYASIAFAKTEQNDQAKTYLDKALKLYLTTEDYSELFLSNIHGEYSILLWNMGLYHECIDSCEKILVYIEKYITEETNEECKSVAMVLGHILGYFYPILSGNTAPEKTADGSVYVIPSNRFFLYTGKEVGSLFDIEKLFVLYFHMYNFFYILNDSNKGNYYLHKAFEVSKKSTLEDLKILLYKDTYLFNRDYINYFHFVLSLQSKTSQQGMMIFILLSFLCLITQLMEGDNQIDTYKSQFMIIFSDTLEKKYFDAIINTLNKLNHFEDTAYVEEDWITNRFFLLSDIYHSTIGKALDIHQHMYNDFFVSNSLPISPVIEKEILEKYFFDFWVARIHKSPSNFQYSSSLLTRIEKINLDVASPKVKITELFTLVSRYKKS